MSKLKSVTVHIQDVDYIGEDITLAEDSPYNNVIYLLLKEKETSNLYVCILTPTDVKDLANLEADLSPREMNFFADQLKLRKSPMTLVVSPEDELVTAEMLQMSEEDLILLQQQEELSKQQTQAIRAKFGFKNFGDVNV